jgi:hypothetical protein
MVDSELDGGAEDLCAKVRGSGRVAEWDGCTYLLPSVIHVPSKEHSLANREFGYPHVSVVQVEPHDLPECLGPTLVCTALTNDKRLHQRLLANPHIGRLNLGPISTMKISWDQPHEGNLFDHLYSRRAFQAVPELVG